MPKVKTGSKYKKKYTKEDLSTALALIRDAGMPIREAARIFDIPRATLQFRLIGNCSENTKPGPPTVLTETEEKLLADWIILSSKKGFPRRKEDVLNCVEQFMQKAPRPNVFKNNKPGEGWYKLFLKRHPEIATRTAEAVTSASANVTEQNIKNWFKQIEGVLTKEQLKILEDPDRIFNGDETGFQLCPKQGKVLAEKGARDVYEIDMAPAKSNLTVMFTFSASGKVTPPMIIYPLQRVSEDIKRSVPLHWGISTSENGWMTKEIFFKYVTHILYGHLVRENVTFPVILFVDGHKSHINFDLSEKCKELGIILIALYPNATRILQPADVAAFKPIKNGWRKALLEWRRANISKQLNKVDFGRVLTIVVNKYINKEVIINGFRTCGLYPWNANAINYAKCLGKDSLAQPPVHSSQHNTMNMDDFKKIVGTDVFSAIQNDITLSASDSLQKALKNIYRFLNGAISLDTISNDQRCVLVEDDWLPIDDIPFVMEPSFEEDVEEFVTMTSHVICKSSADHDIITAMTEEDQEERSAGKNNTKGEHIEEAKKAKMEINEIEHNVLLGDETKETKGEILENMSKEVQSEQLEAIDNKIRSPGKENEHRVLAVNEKKETNTKGETPEVMSKLVQSEQLEEIDNKITSPGKENEHKISAVNEKKETNTKGETPEVMSKLVQNEQLEAIGNKITSLRKENVSKKLTKSVQLNAIDNKVTSPAKDNEYNILAGDETKESKTEQEIPEVMTKLVQSVQFDISDNKLTSPAKLEDFLYKAPTPKRKGKIISQHSSVYVLTSDEWLRVEREKQEKKEKTIAEKLERKQNRELAKQAKDIKKEETKNKNIKKKKVTNENETESSACKRQKTNLNNNKNKENVLTTTDIIYIGSSDSDDTLSKVKTENEPILFKDTDKIQTKEKTEKLPSIHIKQIEKLTAKEKKIITETANKNNTRNKAKRKPVTIINNETKVTQKEKNADAVTTKVKPSEFIISVPQIINRRSTFKNEEELQEYMKKYK